MPGPALGPDAHASRAARHRKIGDALAAAGDEWAAVCYFYSAYHLVRRALLVDPVFDTLERAQAKHPDLLPEDRSIGRHSGRKRTSAGREWGVNELVLRLYPQIASAYDRLHQASIDVRYQNGLRTTLAPIVQSLEHVEREAAAGTLSAWSGPDEP